MSVHTLYFFVPDWQSPPFTWKTFHSPILWGSSKMAKPGLGNSKVENRY